MLYHNQYCRAWLIGEHARVDHENTLKRAHSHMEIKRVVNRDQRRIEKQHRFIARREAQKGLNVRPLAYITPPRKVCAQTAALETFQTEGKRCEAYHQDAIKRRAVAENKKVRPSYMAR
ncbi:hypothetical protein RvY_01612 [Ramazzottius varieornatus]|uniref:Uncharacterized protein n=1 Tax=Ramazzottius varieornatus TaxID=947166 RepID=A0A1D1URM2_RAMVA|nr:hypothetical protein RvY_01612 [Ramazzottius varieornatus]